MPNHTGTVPLLAPTLFTIAKLWKQPRCPSTDEWIKKMWYLYTVEFYAATKKNEMDGTGEHHLK
jgi:hypothetical protein